VCVRTRVCVVPFVRANVCVTLCECLCSPRRALVDWHEGECTLLGMSMGSKLGQQQLQEVAFRVCACVHMRVPVCMCPRARVCVRMSVFLCSPGRRCVGVCACAQVRARVCTRACACASVSVSFCNCARVRACVYVSVSRCAGMCCVGACRRVCVRV